MLITLSVKVMIIKKARAFIRDFMVVSVVSFKVESLRKRKNELNQKTISPNTLHKQQVKTMINFA